MSASQSSPVCLAAYLTSPGRVWQEDSDVIEPEQALPRSVQSPAMSSSPGHAKQIQQHLRFVS